MNFKKFLLHKHLYWKDVVSKEYVNAEVFYHKIRDLYEKNSVYACLIFKDG